MRVGLLNDITIGPNLEAFAPGYISWPSGPRRLNGSSIRLQAPLISRDDTNQFNLIIGGNRDASLLVDGVGGIATSQFPAQANTFYNIRALNDSTLVNPTDIDLIEFGTSPPLPSGYDFATVLNPPILTTGGAQWSVVLHSVQGTAIRTYHMLNETLSQSLEDGAEDVNTVHILNSISTGTLLVPTGVRLIAHLNIGFMTGAGGNAGDQVNINANESTTSGQNQRIGPGFVSGTKLRQNMDTLTGISADIKYLVSDEINNRVDIYVSGFSMNMRL